VLSCRGWPQEAALHAARELEGILPLEAAESEELAGAVPERRELTPLDLDEKSPILPTVLQAGPANKPGPQSFCTLTS
jgi:hypothetical protein